jgi:hypothetical protein
MNEILSNMPFSSLVEALYDLSFDDKVELKYLLEHNIAEERRNQILKNSKKARKEYSSGKLAFSADIEALKSLI